MTRTVVVGPNWIGDTVMSLPALASLRGGIETGEVHVVCPAPLGQVVRMTHLAHKVWEFQRNESILKRAALMRMVCAQRAVIFPNSFKSALVTWLARIPERWGYSVQGRWLFLTNRVKPKANRRPRHHSEFYLALVEAMGVRREGVQWRLEVPREALVWADMALGDRDTWVGICPGAAYGPAKRWPLDRFVQTAERLIRERGVGAVFLGDDRDARALEGVEIIRAGQAISLAGRTDLFKLAAVMSRCRVIICNDSGPMHLAAALGIPVVAIFGSTDPMITGPRGPHRILRASLPCTPCLERTCRKKDYQCLTQITVNQVVQATWTELESSD